LGFSRPLNVVTTRPDDWETPRFDLSGYVSEVNAMKSRIPPLNDEGLERRLTTGDASALALVRYASRGRNYAFALINPDPNAAAELEVGADPYGGQRERRPRTRIDCAAIFPCGPFGGFATVHRMTTPKARARPLTPTPQPHRADRKEPRLGFH
jgi:hypothetical protein